ncbi:MAG: hypothetical protein AAFQ34_13200 [Pseudomonadota bacterium]
MPTRKPNSKERYEELMRNAGEKKRALNRAALQRERESLRIEREHRRRTDSIASNRLIPFVSLIEGEIDDILAEIAVARHPKRIARLRADLARLRNLIAAMREDYLRRRKPPESGLAVPVEPPRGPFPKQGGAAAPLDFGTD